VPLSVGPACSRVSGVLVSESASISKAPATPPLLVLPTAGMALRWRREKLSWMCAATAEKTEAELRPVAKALALRGLNVAALLSNELLATLEVVLKHGLATAA
jgi:hypothetical protein